MLLKPVGGRGQEALLAAPVRVLGLSACAAYLAAGGTPVHSAASGGFFARAPLGEFNPDAVPTTPPAGLVARAVHDFPADERLAVAIGGDGLAFKAGGCHDCFLRTAKALSKDDPSLKLQALGALAWQRIALGLADTLGAAPGTVLRCEAHA